MVVTRVVLVELGSLLFQPPAETGIVTERNARPDTAACSVIPQKLRASKQRTAATVPARTMTTLARHGLFGRPAIAEAAAYRTVRRSLNQFRMELPTNARCAFTFQQVFLVIGRTPWVRTFLNPCITYRNGYAHAYVSPLPCSSRCGVCRVANCNSGQSIVVILHRGRMQNN